MVLSCCHMQPMHRQFIQIALSVATIAIVGVVFGLWYAALPGHDLAKLKELCEGKGGTWLAASSTCELPPAPVR